MAILIQKYPKKYFGINDTTNIFTGDAVPIDVTDEYFRIPSVVNIQGEEWVAVNTGYVPLATQPTADFEFEICDDNGRSLQKLSLIIGTAKDPSSKPASNVVVWFNESFVKGCYYVNSQWLGKVFHIIKGKYVSTTANSNRLNEISSNYDFVNNVEQAINDKVDSNNINVTYSDKGDYIEQKQIVNNKNIIPYLLDNQISSIKSNVEFDTKKTLDGKKIYGRYVVNSLLGFLLYYNCIGYSPSNAIFSNSTPINSITLLIPAKRDGYFSVGKIVINTSGSISFTYAEQGYTGFVFYTKD